jgi:SAM-dependent methyltransferase
MVNVFDTIYQTNRWGYKSGPGSDPDHAKPWIDIVNSFLAKPDIQTIIDIGCGDWRLGQTYNLENKVYTGIDVSSTILDETKVYATRDIRFVNADFEFFDTDPVDLILIKDVLQHLPTQKVINMINKITKHARYALICEDIDTAINNDIPEGDCRAIDLSKPPFSFDFEKLRGYNRKQIYLYTTPIE